MDRQRDLELILRSRTPIVVIETRDEARMLELLKSIAMARAADTYLPLFRWTVTDGLQRLDISLRDTEQLAHNAIYQDGVITKSDLPRVMQAKYELLNRGGVLRYEYDTRKFSDIGGLTRLKAWITQRKPAFMDRNVAAQLDSPKGIMLIGVQGCGKCLAAKATAGILGVPLLRLDFGSLYDKYHGETERKLRESLATADIMAPCVLWIDEIEKGIAGRDSETGTSQRVLGTFLTWLAEKTGQVFVVATANDIGCAAGRTRSQGPI